MSYVARIGLFLGLLALILILVWSGLKNYGENRPISPYQTELIKTLQKEEKPILWLNSTQQNSADFLSIRARHSSAGWQIDNLNEPLEEHLSKLHYRFLLLDIDLRSSKALPALREILKKEDRWKQTIICSRSDGILTDLRQLEPDWSFCNGEIFMTRMLAFHSLGLQSLQTIRSDVFFIHLKNLPIKPSLQGLIDEAHRQNKLVFLGTVAGPSESLSPDGWVINR